MAHTVEIKEIINGVQITETLDGNVVEKLISYQAKPFLRTTNETGEETYQIIDKVGEIYNIPALSTSFRIIDANDAVFIPANGVELIEYSLKLRLFRPDAEDDEYYIGNIATTANSLTMNLPVEGVNWAKIGGNFYEKYYPDTFNFTPVTTGEKILIIHALPDAQVFHLAQGVESTEAVEPTYSGLFVARILVNSEGADITEAITGFKLKANDAWVRTWVNYTTDIQTLSIHHAALRFIVQAGHDGVKIGGFQFYKPEFLYDGVEITLRNATLGDLELATATESGYNLVPINPADLPVSLKIGESCTLAYDAYANVFNVQKMGSEPDLSGYATTDELEEKVDKPTDEGTFSLKKLGSVFSWVAVQAGLDSTGLVDKMGTYWDATGGKLVSNGLKFVSGVVNQLEFTGRIKADAIILPNNTNLVVPNRLRSDGSRLKYSNELSAESDIAYLTDISGILVYRKVITENTVVTPPTSGIDYANALITISGHGLSFSGVKFCGIFVNSFALISNNQYIPFEWRNAKTFLKIIDTNTVQICNSAGVPITVNTADSKNSIINSNHWHIELFADLTFPVPSLDTLTFIIKGLCVSGKDNASSRAFGFGGNGGGIGQIVVPNITEQGNNIFSILNVKVQSKDKFYTVFGLDNYKYHNNAFGFFGVVRQINLFNETSNSNKITYIVASYASGYSPNLYANGSIVEIYS